MPTLLSARTPGCACGAPESDTAAVAVVSNRGHPGLERWLQTSPRQRRFTRWSDPVTAGRRFSQDHGSHFFEGPVTVGLRHGGLSGRPSAGDEFTNTGFAHVGELSTRSSAGADELMCLFGCLATGHLQNIFGRIFLMATFSSAWGPFFFFWGPFSMTDSRRPVTLEKLFM